MRRLRETVTTTGGAGLSMGVRRLGRGAAVCGAVLLQAFAPSSARARESLAGPLRFTAPAACPTAEAFRAALDARTVRSRTLPRAPHDRILVTIVPEGSGWTGRIVVESTVDGVRIERTARAEDCESLVPALALMAALALDLEPSATEPPPPAPVEQTDSRFSSQTADASPNEGVASLVPRSPARRLTEGEIGFLVPWRSVVGWRDRVAVAPSVLWGSRADRGFSPWVRLSAARLATEIANSSTFEASLTWTIGQLEGCTHKWALGGKAFVSPCVRFSAGVLQARGRAGVHSPRERTRFWLTAGAGAELATPIVEPLWLRVQGGVEAIVLRQRVYANGDPDHTLAEMPPALGVLGVGLGVRIW